MSMPSDRPYSRESSALRRLLAADDTSPPATHVYGDGDIVTVCYVAESGRWGAPHRSALAACVAALARLEEHDLAPDRVRGVCHVDDTDVPLVWLLPREWAAAYAAGDAATADVSAPTVTHPGNSAELEQMTTDLITTHG